MSGSVWDRPGTVAGLALVVGFVVGLLGYAEGAAEALVFALLTAAVAWIAVWTLHHGDGQPPGADGRGRWRHLRH